MGQRKKLYLMNIELLKAGMSRAEVVSVWGEPDAKGGTSRKYKAPSIYKYGDIELFFAHGNGGKLATIWDEKNEVVIKEF